MARNSMIKTYEDMVKDIRKKIKKRCPKNPIDQLSFVPGEGMIAVDDTQAKTNLEKDKRLYQNILHWQEMNDVANHFCTFMLDTMKTANTLSVMMIVQSIKKHYSDQGDRLVKKLKTSGFVTRNPKTTLYVVHLLSDATNIGDDDQKDVSPDGTPDTDTLRPDGAAVADCEDRSYSVLHSDGEA